MDITLSGGTPPYTIIGDTTGLTSGNYSVTVEDESGNTECLLPIEFTINEPANLDVNIQINDASCFEYSDGTASISPFGGTPPYTIIADSTNLNEGIYPVSITDAQGCELDTTFQVGEPDLLEITSIDITNVTCNGESDGAVDISLNGGTPPYQFLDPTSGLAAGTYSINIIDAQECEINTEVIIKNLTHWKLLQLM